MDPSLKRPAPTTSLNEEKEAKRQKQNNYSFNMSKGKTRQVPNQNPLFNTPFPDDEIEDESAQTQPNQPDSGTLKSWMTRDAPEASKENGKNRVDQMEVESNSNTENSHKNKHPSSNSQGNAKKVKLDHDSEKPHSQQIPTPTFSPFKSFQFNKAKASDPPQPVPSQPTEISTQTETDLEPPAPPKSKSHTFGSNRDPSLGLTNQTKQTPNPKTSNLSAFIPRQVLSKNPSLNKGSSGTKASATMGSNGTSKAQSGGPLDEILDSMNNDKTPLTTKPSPQKQKTSPPVYGPAIPPNYSPKSNSLADKLKKDPGGVASYFPKSVGDLKPPETKLQPSVQTPLAIDLKTYIIEDTNLGARCKDIPIRLAHEERELLGLLEAALDVSEYTDKVDVFINNYSRTNIMRTQLSELFSLIIGLYVAQNNAKGKKLVLEQNRQAREEFIQRVFEVGRRYKIMNPDKMRTTHGKLLFIMQDAATRDDIKVRTDIRTVQGFLQRKKAAALLQEPDLVIATRCVESSDIQELKEQHRLKTEATNRLIEKFQTAVFSKEDLTLVLDSIADSNAYTLSHRHPIDRMIGYLHTFFNPVGPTEPKYSLQINVYQGGSKLSHNHSTQFNFVHQSLLLWREIQHNMFKLWKAADKDLLDRREYRLTDTGQGFNRVQPASTVNSIMSSILNDVKSKVRGAWVGLSVVHLGDKDVPNALVFINKYCQVPYILGPIVSTLDRIRSMAESDPAVKIFVKQYGGVKQAQSAILCDFFKHGFDGSGDSGGSCIDGRLTSAWNWCSKIESKPYYPLFLLTGFLGFDGSFRR